MTILDRLPIGEGPSVLFVGSEAVTIKRYQLAVWVSINDAARPFPAVLDTGHSHNFSITEGHLRRWAGLRPDRLRFIGTTRLRGERLRQYRADVRIHRNTPGTPGVGNRSLPLAMDEGISVVPDGSIRLPLLGMRAIVRNDLRLRIDGRRRMAWLSTSRWPWA